jgi:hypothetical protein
MDDGKREKWSIRGIITLIMTISAMRVVFGLDTELESMRQEGLEKHDISIFMEERAEFIHSRISTKNLLNSIEHANKLGLVFGTKANTSLGKVLYTKLSSNLNRLDNKVNRMYGKVHSRWPKKLRREKRALEFVGNLISMATLVQRNGSRTLEIY